MEKEILYDLVYILKEFRDQCKEISDDDVGQINLALRKLRVIEGVGDSETPEATVKLQKKQLNYYSAIKRILNAQARGKTAVSVSDSKNLLVQTEEKLKMNPLHRQSVRSARERKKTLGKKKTKGVKRGK